MIGGGDWATDRIVPDIIRAQFEGKKIEIRNPYSIRPWQHVLESLTGYLILGSYLLQGKEDYAEAWNFGPDAADCISVTDLLSLADPVRDFVKIRESHTDYHESEILMLDSSRARNQLGWKSIWKINEAVTRTMNWYRSFYLNGRVLTNNDISDYLHDAVNSGACWIKG